MLKEVFGNKVAIFNIVLVSAILIFLLTSNIQQEINIEEYATIPTDYTPILGLTPISTPTKIEERVELQYDKDTFLIEYMIGIGKSTDKKEIVCNGDNNDNETKPLPLSPATSLYFITSSSSNSSSTLLALAIKKITDEPALYVINIALFTKEDYDLITCYFSDPFPTGYNSMLLYMPIEADKVRIEVKKVKILL